MKNKFILVYTLLLLGPTLFSQTQFAAIDSWKNARQQASKSNKYILVKAYTDWCGYCKKQEKEIFARKDVGAYVNENFLPVNWNFDGELGIKMARKFRVTAYPTLLLFSPEGELVDKHVGFQPNPEKVIARLKKTKQQAPLPIDTENLDLQFPDFYTKAIAPNGKRKFPTAETVFAYLENQENYFSEVNWSIIFLLNKHEKYQQYFLDHYARFSELYGQSETQQLLLNIAHQAIVEAGKIKDKKQLDYYKNLLEQHLLNNKQQSQLYLAIDYFRAAEDWTSYSKTIQKLTMLEGLAQMSESLNFFCWEIYENVNDQNALKTAHKLMKQVVQIHDDYAYWDTYAALLYKLKRKRKAHAACQKAISLGIKQKSNVTETRQLSVKIAAL